MSYVIDTCAWIEWISDGKLASKFADFFQDYSQIIVPTLIQFELYRWVEREKNEEAALSVIGVTEQAKVIELSTRIALSAAELAKQHSLAMADAIIYATALTHDSILVTSDKHFKGLESVNYFDK